MSGRVTSRGYRVPAGQDTVQVPVDIGNLADDVNADIAALVAAGKLGTAPVGSNGSTLASSSGFGSATVSAIPRNGWMFMQLQVLKVTAALTAPATGNIANTQLGTLTGNRPPIQDQARAYCSFTGGTAVLNTDGSWILTDLNPSSTVNVGDFIRCSFKYPY